MPLLSAALLVFCASAGVRAQQAPANPHPLEAFANLPQMEFPALSPDGTYIAFLRPVEGKRALFVRPRNAPDSESLHLEIKAEIDFDIYWFRWVSNRFLVVATTFAGRRGGLDTVETRLLTVARQGTSLKSLDLKRNGHQPQVQTDIVNLLQDQPNQLLLSMEANAKGRIDIFRLNVRTGRLRVVERGTPDTSRWVTDDASNVRIRTDIVGTQKIIFLKGTDDRWRVLKQFDFFNAPDFEPHGFLNENTLYVASTHENGRRGVYTFDIAENTFKERLFLQDDVDVLSLGRHRNGQLWGFHYANTRFATKTIDPIMQDRMAVINQELPDTFNLLLNNSESRRYYLLHASTSNDPGTYYLHDNDHTRLREIGRQYPSLPADTLGKVAPFNFKARDGLSVPAFVTLPRGAALGRTNKKWPVVVMPHGGPRSRDYPSFDYIAHFLADRGYAVLRVNFRGSLGYGRNFEARGFKQWGKSIQDDITDGFRALVESGFADPERACIAGGSFGGYSAMMAAARWPDLYKCAVSLNGAMDLLRFAEFAQGYRFAGLVDKRLGHPKDDRRLLQEMSPINLAERIQIPTLLVHSTSDRRVTPDHSQDMHKALLENGKQTKLVLIPGGDHGLSRAAYRTQYLSELEQFLKQNIGP